MQQALTVRQACLIASVFTFGGAMALGSAVAKTIAGGIVAVLDFEATPAVCDCGANHAPCMPLQELAPWDTVALPPG